MEILILAMIIGILPAAIAHSKGHSFILWWIFGTMLWIVALPISICLDKKTTFLTKRCQFCQEIVNKESTVCKHCGNTLPHIAKQQVLQNEVSSGYCNSCKKPIPKRALYCRYCNTKVEKIKTVVPFNTYPTAGHIL